MKLTKAQRLFVAVGRADNEMQYYKYLDSVVEPHICDGYGEEIKKFRSRRKKLIREALEAWRDAELDNFIAGYNACQNDEIL